MESTGTIPDSDIPLALSLDGGGIRGLSILMILNEIVNRLKSDLGIDPENQLPQPFANYFSLIGGTGTGGIIASMLGPLGMHVEDAIPAYADMMTHMWANAPESTPETRSELLKTKFEELVARKFPNSPDVKLRSNDTKAMCKTFVCAQPASAVNIPRLFRTYNVRENPAHNCSIWEAARATSAMPELFSSIRIGPPMMEEQFIDGGLGCNNPLHQVLSEAKGMKLDMTKIKILSVGAGHPGNIVHKSAERNGYYKTAMKIAVDCEKLAHEVHGEFREKGCADDFIRVNVQHGLEDFNMEEWKNVATVKTVALAHIRSHQVSDNINSVVALLKKKELARQNLVGPSTTGTPIQTHQPSQPHNSGSWLGQLATWWSVPPPVQTEPEAEALPEYTVIDIKFH